MTIVHWRDFLLLACGVALLIALFVRLGWP
jgi:hypothetical protein